jgi:drug/metabolite transporter (DMT)-like permease
MRSVRKILAFILLCFLWGVSWALIKVTYRAAPPLMAAALRITAAGLILGAAGLALRMHQKLGRRDLGLLALTALLSFTLSYGCVYVGEQRISAALAAVLFATFPAATVLFSHLHGLEWRLGGVRLVGIAVSFLGTLLLFADRLQLPEPSTYGYALLCLLSPVVGAWNMVLIKKHGQHLNALTLNFLPMLFGGVLLFPLSFAIERGPYLKSDPAGWGSLIFLATFSTALAFFLYYWLLQTMKATTLSLVTYFTTCVAALSGYVILDEPLTWIMGLGAVVIFFGIFLVLRKDRGSEPVTGEP